MVACLGAENAHGSCSVVKYHTIIIRDALCTVRVQLNLVELCPSEVSPLYWPLLYLHGLLLIKPMYLTHLHALFKCIVNKQVTENTRVQHLRCSSYKSTYIGRPHLIPGTSLY